MGDLSRSPAKLEDDDKREVVDEDGPAVGVVAADTVREDEREGNDDAYCTCREEEQELLDTDWILRLNDAEQELLGSDWLYYILEIHKNAAQTLLISFIPLLSSQ